MLDIDAPLARLIFTKLQQLPSYEIISFIGASLLVYLQALIINYTGSIHNILHKDSMFPGLFFVIISSIYKEQLFLSSQIISNTFMVILFYRICYLYDHPKPLLPVFDSGVLLGLALLFNYKLIMFLPFILMGIVVITSFNLRYIFIAIIGIITPLYFLALIFYLADSFYILEKSILDSLQQEYFNAIEITFKDHLVWLIALPLLATSLIRLQLNYFKNKVKTRRLQLLVILFLAVSIAEVITEQTFYKTAFIYLSLPLAFILGNYFLSNKKLLLRKAVLVLIITLSLFSQYFS